MIERLPAKCFSHLIILLSAISLCFFLPSFFLVVFYLVFFSFLSFLPLSTHCPLPFQLTFCLSSVFFNFLAVFHLCCCAPFNLFWSILPLPLVPSSLSLPRSLSFSPYLFSSPSHYPSALLPAFSSPTKDQDKCAF